MQTVSTPTPQQVFHAVTRPKRRPTSDEDSQALASGARHEFLHAGLKLAAWSWGNGDSTVLLLHGWESRASHMAAFVTPLLKAGYRVVAFDAPGHGDSEGSVSDAVDYGRAVISAVAALGKPAAVIGHSVGSAAALYAFSHELTVHASVHIAGPSSMERVLRRGAVAAGLSDQGVAEFLSLMTRQVGEPLSVMDLSNLSDGLKHPSLIIHDQQDKEMPYSESVELTNSWPLSTFMSVQGVGHRRILRDDDTILLATHYLAEKLKGQ